MGQLSVVVGGQFGSEGKGAITAHLAKKLGPTDMTIRVAGPNAGHTAWDRQGREWKLRQVPAAAAVSPCRLGIAAGSEIDLPVLADEMRQMDAAGHSVSSRLWVHPSATIIEDKHKHAEQREGLTERIGSTGKGIGAARAARLMREAEQVRDLAALPLPVELIPAGWPLALWPNRTSHVVIEGTQGYGLGLHTRFYPQVTSSDCRAIDFLSMAGISPWAPEVAKLDVWVVARVYPIRVAGNSGPLVGETSWGALGLPEERTTVTHKVRRVGMWDTMLVCEAVKANGGAPVAKLALTMLDQMFPEVAGVTDPGHLSRPAMQFITEVEQAVGTRVGLVGTSPTTVVEMPEPRIPRQRSGDAAKILGQVGF